MACDCGTPWTFLFYLILLKVLSERLGERRIELATVSPGGVRRECKSVGHLRSYFKFRRKYMIYYRKKVLATLNLFTSYLVNMVPGLYIRNDSNIFHTAETFSCDFKWGCGF